MIYTIANQKGGVGKSSTASALVAGLTAQGHSCLAIDMDPQCNLTFAMGGNRQTDKTVLQILTREASAAEAIQHMDTGDLIPASGALAGADAFINEPGKEYRLREALEPIADQYDYIILDTPPALGVITVNALTACNSVIIPAQADAFSLQGITELLGTIRPVQKYCNPRLKIAGVLLTRYSSRSVLSREVSELMRDQAESIGTRLFSSTIREAVSVKEAQMMQQDIFTYAPASNVAADYSSFIHELQNLEE